MSRKTRNRNNIAVAPYAADLVPLLNKIVAKLKQKHRPAEKLLGMLGTRTARLSRRE
jgi:hypothetical protein